MKLFKWIPSSLATWIYTVIFKPKFLRVFIQKIICLIIPEKITVGGVSLCLNQQDAVVSGSLALGFYEKSNIDLFSKMYEGNASGKTFLDVGANIGLYSALAAKYVGSSGKVISVEPDEVNCSFIKKTIRANSFSNIDVYQTAAGDYDGTAKLFLNELNKADHRLYDNTEERAFQTIDIMKIDTIMKNYEGRKVDFVKIDTQGYEYRVLKGMKETIAANPGIKIVMEFWPWGIVQAGDNPKDLLTLIQDLGFTIKRIDEDLPVIHKIEDAFSLLDFDKERQHVDLYIEKGD